jgi:hypothetical protein
MMNPETLTFGTRRHQFFERLRRISIALGAAPLVTQSTKRAESGSRLLFQQNVVFSVRRRSLLLSATVWRLARRYGGGHESAIRVRGTGNPSKGCSGLLATGRGRRRQASESSSSAAATWSTGRRPAAAGRNTGQGILRICFSLAAC